MVVCFFFSPRPTSAQSTAALAKVRRHPALLHTIKTAFYLTPSFRCSFPPFVSHSSSSTDGEMPGAPLKNASHRAMSLTSVQDKHTRCLT